MKRAVGVAILRQQRPNAPLEIINWRVEARGPEPDLPSGYSLQGGNGVSAARKGTRRAYFPPDGYRDIPVYDRYGLTPGTEIEGPALVEERESTCLITPGHRAWVDASHNLIAELEI